MTSLMSLTISGCLSSISVSVIKHLDEKQLREEMIDFSQ